MFQRIYHLATDPHFRPFVLVMKPTLKTLALLAFAGLVVLGGTACDEVHRSSDKERIDQLEGYAQQDQHDIKDLKARVEALEQKLNVQQ
jgi:Tfp pilus assembly protein PilN